MKYINPLKKKDFFFHCLGCGGGGYKIHLNQNCRKFHEMDKSINLFFHCLGFGRGGGLNKTPKL